MRVQASHPGRIDQHTYRRRARRLRHQFRNDPLRLHLSLKQLNQTHDQPLEAELTEPRIMSRVERFARLVAARIDGPVLPYSQRVNLLREAERQGIERFDANLIIARMQHQLAPQRVTAPVQQKRAVWMNVAIVVALVQSLIIAGAWALLA